jgi:endoglucanase
MLETMNRLAGETLPATVYAVGTVMEEIGHRGIMMTSYRLAPDMLLALDITICGDTPDSQITDFPHRMGHGPTIKIMDVIMGATGLTAHPRIVEWLMNAAESRNIPYQKEVIMGLNTDASTGHTYRGGIPAGAISIPCRYSHGPSEVVKVDDLENGVELLTTALRQLSADFNFSRV